MNETAFNGPLSQTGILAWRAQAESAYQGVLGQPASTDSATITQLTRLWIHLRGIHEKIEQELSSLAPVVTPGHIVIDQVAASAGRLQGLQRDFAAAILESDAFVTVIHACDLLVVHVLNGPEELAGSGGVRVDQRGDVDFGQRLALFTWPA